MAYGLARGRHRFKTVLRLCVVAPLLVSVVIRTYGWIVLLAGNGVVNQALLALRLVDEPVRFLFTHTGVTDRRSSTSRSPWRSSPSSG